MPVSRAFQKYMRFLWSGHLTEKYGGHIVPCGKFHRIGGAPPETFPNVKYDAPEEVGGDRKCFDSPIKK